MNSENLPAVIEQSAKAQGLQLSQVNLIMPTETFGAVLGEFDKVTIETVTVCAGDPRETYEPNGEGKGFALSKVPLQKIAAALSIQWHPQYTGIVESNATRSRAKAVGIMRKANGETIVQTEEKTIDLNVERENERAKAEKNSLGGRVVRWENRRPIKEPWKSEDERLRWIELEIENSIKQKKRFKDELALTGAKDRVIRSFLALKSTYTSEELSRPLAFPRVTTDTNKLLANPVMRAAAIGLIAPSASSLFGAATPEPMPAIQAEQSDGAGAGAAPVGMPPDQPFRSANEPAGSSGGDDFELEAEGAGAGAPTEDDIREGLVNALQDYLATPNLLSASAADSVRALIDNPKTPIEGPGSLRAYIDKCKGIYEKQIAEGRRSA